MNIFKDKTESMPKEPEEERSYAVPIGESYPKGDGPVRVMQTPAEGRALVMSNYPRYDAMDVVNLKRPRFGHGY